MVLKLLSYENGRKLLKIKVFDGFIIWYHIFSALYDRLYGGNDK